MIWWREPKPLSDIEVVRMTALVGAVVGVIVGLFAPQWVALLFGVFTSLGAAWYVWRLTGTGGWE